MLQGAAGADGGTLEIVLVRQGTTGDEVLADAGQGAAGDDPPAAPDRVIRLPRNLGFAAATNRGIAEARGPYVATVNDDVVVAPGWLRALVEALEATPAAAAAQGVNLQPRGGPGTRPPHRQGSTEGAPAGRPGRWLGPRLEPGGPGGAARPRPAAARSRCAAARGLRGLRDRGGLPAERPARGRPGAAATVGQRRRPGRQDGPDGGAAGDAPEIFDTRLESYYEDADLACRLRAAGHTALSVPAARALHAGSLTGGRLGSRRWRLLYGNRYAVAAGLLGRGVWRRLPRMAARDLVDLARALIRGELRKAFGIAGGWGRAARLLPTFAHRGAPGLRPRGRSRQGSP